MQSRTPLRVTTLWLSFCFLRLHAFPFPIPFDDPYTNQQDVDAINDLYAALGFPDLDGWTNSGGDPCKEAWQGVRCDGPNVTTIELRGADLGGKLSETLGYFTAVTRLDLSNNQIGGGIPQSLPPAITNLDLSSNDLSGELPDSMAKLTSLSTLHVQNNQLTGTLDVLGDLPLKELNVENNLFSGPIPEKLLSIPKFLRNGNHFTLPPVPGSPPTPPTPLLPSTSPPRTPPNNVPAPAAPQEAPVLSGSHPPIYVIPATQVDSPPRHSNRVSPAKAAGFSILAAGSLSIVAVAVVFTVSKWRRERSPRGGYLRRAVMSTPSWVWEPARPPSAVSKSGKERHPAAVEKKELPPRDSVRAAGSSVHPSFKNISRDSVVSDNNVQGSSEIQLSQFSFTFFTVAHLQQCTNSFSDQNLISETCFGKIYLAEHQGNKFVVLKLDGSAAKMPVAEFLKIVQGVFDLRHPNVEELVGCCVDHGQRLLVYTHFSDTTLSDLIHSELPAETLPWDARIAVALEAAKALEYDNIIIVVMLVNYLSAARGERHLVPWATPRLHDLAALRNMADPRLGCQPPVRSLSRFADVIGRCIQQEAEFRPAMSQVAQDLRRALEDARAHGTAASSAAQA
ncbi:hypothetical protein EJB05_25325 [Eragrostis curvula]|uniref:Tyrosine-protein kinase catalytic domain-containing protein n=1 Tax=Eragrostis curvula TaxID=38414 RepID=A0A5J9VB58_9POAL|nr:hypothetical protein EJB05_25325 [Eragrostis curvula]